MHFVLENDQWYWELCRPTIPDKTSATLAKFFNKTQVSKHPPPLMEPPG